LSDLVQTQPAACDGIDHGTTPSRLKELQDEAHAFNNLLRVNETKLRTPIKHSLTTFLLPARQLTKPTRVLQKVEHFMLLNHFTSK
jgi:hypothetical protein